MKFSETAFEALPIGEKAFFSENKDYRYMRTNKFPEICVFIMLNPSGSDENSMSDTMQNCKIIANDLGARGLISVNLFAYSAPRATKMKEAKENNSALDIVGEVENDLYLKSALLEENALVIVAWGDTNDGRRSKPFKEITDFKERVKDVNALIKEAMEKEETKDNKFLCLKNKLKDDEIISHPFWLADAGRYSGESPRERSARMRREVLTNYELVPYNL